MMKTNLIIPTIIAVSLLSCSDVTKSNSPKDEAGEVANTYTQTDASSTSGETDNRKSGEFTIEPYSNSYEDGYEDGQAAAEEDRIARMPGMQSGGDDDDDDDNYEEGYDDGYEDL